MNMRRISDKYKYIHASTQLFQPHCRRSLNTLSFLVSSPAVLITRSGRWETPMRPFAVQLAGQVAKGRIVVCQRPDGVIKAAEDETTSLRPPDG
jgi:hypothetical protein